MTSKNTLTIHYKQEKEVKIYFLFLSFSYKKGKTTALRFSFGMSSDGRASQEKKKEDKEEGKKKKRKKKEEEEKEEK